MLMAETYTLQRKVKQIKEGVNSVHSPIPLLRREQVATKICPLISLGRGLWCFAVWCSVGVESIAGGMYSRVICVNLFPQTKKINLPYLNVSFHQKTINLPHLNVSFHQTKIVATFTGPLVTPHHTRHNTTT